MITIYLLRLLFIVVPAAAAQRLDPFPSAVALDMHCGFVVAHLVALNFHCCAITFYDLAEATSTSTRTSASAMRITICSCELWQVAKTLVDNGLSECSCKYLKYNL